MENSIYIGLSKQTVLRANMTIIANNIANANTTGFRGQNMLFEEFVSDPRGADDELSFVYNRGQYQVTDEGPMRETGNELDIALAGPGFIQIDGPGDEPTYTRDGHFEIDADGTLITSAGFAVEGEGGPITIPEDTEFISIDQNGIISNQDGEIAQITIVEFPNIQVLEAQGNNLYKTDIAGVPAENTKVTQGFLEGSNVNTVLEMTRMIETSRKFQSLQNTLQSENERLQNVIRKLTESR